MKEHANKLEHFTFRLRLHYIGLHRSVAIFIPDSGAVYTTLHHTNPVRSAE